MGSYGGGGRRDLGVGLEAGCYTHAADLRFTLTSRTDFISTNHTIGLPRPPAAYHLLTPFQYFISVSFYYFIY